MTKYNKILQNMWQSQSFSNAQAYRIDEINDSFNNGWVF